MKNNFRTDGDALMDAHAAIPDWAKARTFLAATVLGQPVPITLGLVRTPSAHRFALKVGESGPVVTFQPNKVGVLLQTTVEMATDLLQLDESEF